MDPRRRDQLLTEVQHNQPYGDATRGGAAGTDQQQHKSHGLGKQIKHALAAPAHKLGHDKGAGNGAPWKAPEVPEHDNTQEYAMAGSHAVVAQALLELSQPRNVAVVSTLTSEITGQIGRQLVAEPGRRGTRTVLNEVVVGGFDAVERKGREILARAAGAVPAPFMLAGLVALAPVLLVGVVAGALVAGLGMGVFLVVWGALALWVSVWGGR
jgi:hypothetical protein